MKKLMILGAGIYQVPLIKKAKEMGHYVIVVSYKGNYPGFQYANKVYFQDTTSVEKVVEIAKKEKIDGICTTGTDVALSTIGSVVDELNLTGISSKAGLLSTNKLEMKQRFMDFNVRTAKFLKCSILEEAVDAFNTLEKPVIFKAVDSSGSRGIIRVDAVNEVEKAFNIVNSVTRVNYFIVEEYIEGIEFGAQGFVYNNQLQFFLPHGDTIFCEGGKSVPIGHYVPYQIPGTVWEETRYQLEKTVRALEINNCAINADFILRDDKVYVLEIGARAGATCLPEMISSYFGYDYYEQIINCALGVSPIFTDENKTPCVVELLISEESGVIDQIEVVNTLPESKVQISFDYKTGDEIKKFKEGPDRIGQVVVKGKTIEEVFELLKKVKASINIKLSSSI